MDAKQLPLCFDIEVVYTWNSLDRDEQQLLCMLVYDNGRMIPPKYDATKRAMKSLKEKGLVRVSLISKRHLEITDLGSTLADDYFGHLRQTGQMW